MHVSLTGVAVLSMWGTRFFKSYVVWGLTIFASTLTTKQHYAVDIAAGIVVISAVHTLERSSIRKWLTYPPINKTNTIQNG